VSDHSRSLPEHPNLRYLKVEAKRRLRAGEFTTLDAAQLTIAREHGQPSWAALKRLVDSRNDPTGHAVGQLRWIAARFADADTSGWTAPADDELREHVHDQFLAVLPPALLPSVARRLRADVDVVEDTATHALVRIDGGQLQAVVEPDPPHRLVGLRAYGTGTVADPRLAASGTSTEGPVPAVAREVAARAHAELGLAGLALAAADAEGAVWTLAHGWSCLDPVEPLTTRHRFPACAVTTLVTVTAVLRLVADGRVGLTDPADRHLDDALLADPAVTVRELLCRRDTGSDVLGPLVEHVTGSPSPQVVTDLVLAPLGMDDSGFPGAADVVTGYEPEDDGTLRAVPGPVGTASELWTTAADLVRFGLRWQTLLPEALAREALSPQADLPGGSHVGLGWHLDRTGDVTGLPGRRPGASASLVVRRRDRRVHVALANRNVPVEPVNGRVLRATG
jgi:CubicO group peptidase (beta-lactamase class C family)